jgi:hypothetical protein
VWVHRRRTRRNEKHVAFIQGSEVPRVHFDRIDQNLIRRRDTEWSSGGSVFQASSFKGGTMRSFTRVASKILRACGVERVTSNSCLLRKLENIWFICCRITLPLELFYYLRDCFKEIRYQSDVCYLEYGSVWVLQGYNHIRTKERYAVRKESTLFIATMSFESFIPARC